MARDYRNCYRYGKSGHLTKDCLNCYSYGKPGHFARDCPEKDKSTPKQGNARDCTLTQGEAEAGTSQVVAVVGLILLDEVWVVSLPLGENLTLRFSFKEGNVSAI